MVQEGFSNYFAFCGFDDFLIPCFIGTKLKIRIKITFISYFKVPDGLHTEYLPLFTDDELPEHCIERVGQHLCVVRQRMEIVTSG